MIHPIKRFVQKVAIKVIKATDPNKMSKPHSDYETESVAICRKLISKPDTTLLISPISGKRYIKSDDNQLFIIVELNQLTIVNHAYSYNIDIEGKAHERIARLFDAEVERRREIMEAEIRSNVKHSLSNIYKNLINE
jgi:hypothetical protein